MMSCYRRFLAFKDQFRRQRKIRRRAVIGPAAVAAASIPILLITNSRSDSYDRLVSDWNLESGSSSRSLETGPERNVTPQRACKSHGHILGLSRLGAPAAKMGITTRLSVKKRM